MLRKAGSASNDEFPKGLLERKIKQAVILTVDLHDSFAPFADIQPVIYPRSGAAHSRMVGTGSYQPVWYALQIADRIRVSTDLGLDATT